jgi:hypothetical protein
MLKEVNMDFTRTMNKIIFDLHLEYAGGEGLMSTVSKPLKRCVVFFVASSCVVCFLPVVAHPPPRPSSPTQQSVCIMLLPGVAMQSYGASA